MLYCSDYNCIDHKEELCELYNTVINTCITASDHIPTTSNRIKVKPGWNDNVKQLKEDALSWHHFWKINNRPRVGYVAEMHRISRARYHRAIRHIDRNASKIKSEKIAEAMLSNNSRDMWSEVKKMKGRNSKLTCSIDDCSDSNDIANIFSSKYMELYNSVPYDVDEMKKIESRIMDRIGDCSDDDYSISVRDVIDAVARLKHSKSDGSEGLFSDHFIYGTNRLFVILSLLYSLFLSHGFSPDSMILGTMIPIPKNKKKSLSHSSNYRAIALSSIFSKIFDWIILIKEHSSLCSSDLQFGFKKDTSTTQCSYSMLETIDYYNFNRSVLMLDASKAFNRVNYCKLFNELLKRDISPLVLRLLLYMYTSQCLRVKWGHTLSDCFTVKNGVKQGGVLSPILFAIYTDGMLQKLESTGVGCHMGSHFTGALAYADDLTLLSPSISGLKILIEVCEQYARDFDILFNGNKSQLLFYKGREVSPFML